MTDTDDSARMMQRKNRTQSPFVFRSKDRTSLLVLLLPAFLILLASGSLKRTGYPDMDFQEEYLYQVDPNTAPSIELQLLPGIGEKLAEAVIQHRESSGPFQNHGDIKKVRGIGPKKLESIKPHLIELSPHQQEAQ